MTKRATKSPKYATNPLLICLFTLMGIDMGHASLNSIQPSFLIKGKEMQYEPKKNQSHVEGEAHATRTLAPSKASPLPHTQTLTADRFQINFGNSANQQSLQNIDSIKAEGNVFFQQEDFSIHAEHCTYDCKTNVITCNGNIVLTKGQNILKGDKAKADLESGRYNVTGKDKSDTVQAVLLPNSVHH